MGPSRSALLAIASSLEAQGDALKAQAATIRASVEASESTAPSNTVTLDEHVRRTGQSKRKARETFNAFERAGFRVVRLGHAVSMDTAEYFRAVEALASKRALVSSEHTNSTDDESPEAILRANGLVANTNARKGTRPKRAA